MRKKHQNDKNHSRNIPKQKYKRQCPNKSMTMKNVYCEYRVVR